MTDKLTVQIVNNMDISARVAVLMQFMQMVITYNFKNILVNLTLLKISTFK